MTLDVGLSPRELRGSRTASWCETGSVSFETRHRRKDGSVVDIDATVNWENAADGRYFAFMRDITARKEAEAVRDRQLEILEAIPDLVGMADDEWRLLYLNPAGRRLLGIDRIDGLRVADLHPPWLAGRLAEEVEPRGAAGDGLGGARRS